MGEMKGVYFLQISDGHTAEFSEQVEEIILPKSAVQTT